jgi:hypothetical protein
VSTGTGPVEGSSQRARSQLRFRQLNEQIRTISLDGELVVLCECVNADCTERLAVPVAVYEAVRRFPTRFLVKEGHVAEGVERVVRSEDGVVVVEKTGADAERAIVLDPRRRDARRLRVVESDADLPLTRELRP